MFSFFLSSLLDLFHTGFEFEIIILSFKNVRVAIFYESFFFVFA